MTLNDDTIIKYDDTRMHFINSKIQIKLTKKLKSFKAFEEGRSGFEYEF